MIRTSTRNIAVARLREMERTTIALMSDDREHLHRDAVSLRRHDAEDRRPPLIAYGRLNEEEVSRSDPRELDAAAAASGGPPVRR